MSEILTRLQHALTTKSTVEQAKGLLSAAGDRTIEQAPGSLREYARREGLPISQVAARLVPRTLAPDQVLHAGADGTPSPGAEL
ncbi:ANTAR domain-containing protein [Streptomyces sp. H10-C2]|uniref:ANTAR domain-containing protein n=1 Tax=unclassified Streptomyces TaxID=2593676 RepID=UPI0024B9EA0C|nr:MULTISPECIES: ANTAR domain-containing protein [unclassified Streptomyces]MDJ0340919.1 ANTAR domain-containing protein [Streptomyces sp. PH10-H1]MDJ0369849.1 ANTAR domain-containing protein [Streptomyces sp. H10-C2]